MYEPDDNISFSITDFSDFIRIFGTCRYKSF